MRRPLLLGLAPIAVASALVLGCGSGAVQLSRDEYSRLPREYRLELFDAENDLVIARNRQDEAEDKKAAAERALTELGRKWDRTNKRLSSAGQAAKIAGARHVFDMNAAYVSSQIDVAAAGIRRAEAETRVREARLDLVAQRQAARIGRATTSSIKPFETRVASLEERLKAATTAEVDLRTKVQAQLTAWKTAEDQYVASASDYDTGVWDN